MTNAVKELHMNDTSARTRLRDWTRDEGRGVRYGFFARLGDWWCATRDARTVLPKLIVPAADEEGAPAPGEREGMAWGTPRTVFLGQLGRGWVEKEWIRYQAAIADHLIALKQAQARRDLAVDSLETAEQRLAGLTPPQGAELTKKVSGEQQTRDEIVAGRRMAEYVERRAKVENEVNTLRTKLAESEVETARLFETVRIRFEVAQARAQMIGAYVRRRCASYLTRLVRKHPDGQEIFLLTASQWRDLPAWVARDLPAELQPAPATVGGR